MKCRNKKQRKKQQQREKQLASRFKVAFAVKTTTIFH